MKKFVVGILTLIGLGFGTIFAQNVILPDSAEIKVKDPVIMGEATNMTVTIMKNGSKMNNYNGTIWIVVTEQDGTKLKDNEYTVPSRGMYTFLSSDLGEKVFQRGLEIKKEGTFYVEISDLNDNEEKVLGKQLIHVVRGDSIGETYDIDVFSPESESNQIGDKLTITAAVIELPNSEAVIKIDDKEVGKTTTDSLGQINYTVGNVEVGSHTLLIEIPDMEGNIMGTSKKIYFITSPADNDGIKDVVVNPEKGLMKGDTTNVTVYTDELVDSVSMRLSDREDNDKIVMNKKRVGEFSETVFLYSTGEISLSFDLSSSNNLFNQSFEDYKRIKVIDIPSISEVTNVTDAETQSANISWKTIDETEIISSYQVNYRSDSGVLSGEERTTNKSILLNGIPFDTTIYLNITPYRSNKSRHGSASKTIQFVITKDGKSVTSVCGNGICEEGEDYNSCPEDCAPICGNGICEEGEDYNSCPDDCMSDMGPICTVQNVSTRTTEVGNSHYLIWDKVDNVSKYIVYSSSDPSGRNKVKVYETTDTSYEYPFDYTAKEKIFMYFWIVGICKDGEELELTGATKVQVGPTENFFLLVCLTLIIYFGIKLFRETE